MSNNKYTLGTIGIALALILSIFAAAGFGQTSPQFVSATTVGEDTTTTSDIEETQAAATEFITEELQQVDGVEFISRWGPVATIAADDVAVLIADCNPGEFAVSGQTMFESIQVRQVSDFAIAFEGANLMSWLVIAENTHSSEPKDASAGVICADESGDDGDDNDNNDASSLDITVRTALQTAVNQFIVQGGDVDIDITNLVNIVQNITQVANIVNNITGNNNTVISVINQTAQNVANINASNINVGQIINQTAVNVVEQSGNQSAVQEIEEEIETPETGNTTAVTGFNLPPVIEEEEEQDPVGGVDGAAEEPATTTTEEETVTEEETEEGEGAAPSEEETETTPPVEEEEETEEETLEETSTTTDSTGDETTATETEPQG